MYIIVYIMIYMAHVWENMVNTGCEDIPAFVVGGCYGFNVDECFFLTFDVLCGGDCGTILPRTFTSLFGLR